MLQAVVEEAKQELIGQKGGIMSLLLSLLCHKEKTVFSLCHSLVSLDPPVVTNIIVVQCTNG